MSYLEPPDPIDHDEECPAVCIFASLTPLDSTCPNDHASHECACAEIAEDRAEQEAQALWEMRAFDAWERQQP